MRPRNAELTMLFLSILIAVGTFVLVDFARAPKVSPDLAKFMIAFTALAIGGHIAVRKLAPNADPLLYSVSILLAGFGYGEIRRLAPDLASAQLGWITIGMVAFVLTLLVVRDHRQLEQFRYSFLLLGIVLLLLPMSPIGSTLGRSAKLWIRLGPLAFQPAELAKVVLAIFLAGYLSSKHEVMTIAAKRIGPLNLPAPRHFGPLLLAWGLSLAVMFYERDLGSSTLFFALFVITLYAATSRAAYALAGIAMFSAGVWYAYQHFAHVSVRICAWLHPWSATDTVCGIQAAGRQIAQSAFALGTGGLTGTGLGRGHPELIDPGLRSGTLPTDFIFAAIGEEIGFIGTVAILLLFGLIAARGFHIALRSRDTFGTMLAVGLTTIITLQALLIMGGVSRLFPLTGITLPFVSYGGSSIFANFILVALLMRISDDEAVT
ncbi:MAG: FtsW/RodA/SpoVE family cell cycle protein [Actinomycetota bacterium]